MTVSQTNTEISATAADRAVAADSVTASDISIGTKSANLTVTTSTNKYKVLTQEYAIIVDYSTSFIEYQIRPYFTTDYIAYKRANPQYAGEGTVDSSGKALDSVAMRISSYSLSGTSVSFVESCAEFSLKQSFTIYRDYFELDVTYTPGTKKVLTTYYFDLHAASGSRYDLTANLNRYVPGYPEDTSAGAGLGGWYPNFRMFAPASDLRVPGRNMGVEWGYEDTVAYMYSPLWLVGGTGGASVMALKYSSINSVVPNIALGTSQTFHMFVRPYQYSDGKPRGYDVGYASWVAPKIAAKFGNHNTPVFPLAAMKMNTWSASEKAWVESSQIKVAMQSTNSNQIDWHYKYARTAYYGSNLPSVVPKSWQVLNKDGTCFTTSSGAAICNPMSGPYTSSGTYRWQLINNDDYMSWWTSSRGVFWDGVLLWTATNNPVSDYTGRSNYILNGYLALIKESYASGYWDYVIANSFAGNLHLAIAADLTCIEGYEPASTYNNDLTKHVWSTMNLVNNIPATYRPKMLVFQNFASSSSADQSDVYSALWGAAKYGFMVSLLCFDSFESQKHYLVMAEDMFKAMGCTRDSDARTVNVATLDLAQSSTLSTGASMVVMKGSGKATIVSSTSPNAFKLTNLLASSRSFDLRFTGSNLYTAGTNVQTASSMTFTTDGKGTYHGSIGAEKTGEVVKNANLMVQHSGSGSVAVSLSSFSTTAAKVNLAATAGTTTITFVGLAPSTNFKILVDGTQVGTSVSGSDGRLSITRTFGTSDVLEVSSTSSSSSTAPSAPLSLSATAANAKVTLTWSAPSSNGGSAVTGYKVYRGTSSGGESYLTTLSNVLTYTDSSVTNGRIYYYKVGAVNAIGEGPLSGEVSATPVASSTPTVPSAPQSLQATAGTGKVTLTWSAPSSNGGSAVTGYKVYRGTSSGGESYLTTLSNVLTYTDSSVTNGRIYYYKVGAVNAIGEGPLSGESSATPVAYVASGVPSAPQNFQATAGSGKVTLTWSAPASDGGSAIQYYRIWRGTTSGMLSILTTRGNVLTWTNTGLTNGVTYYYKVAAINAKGVGTLSSEVSVIPGTTSITTPTAPQSLSASASNAKVTLTWSAPASNGGSTIAGYQVFRGTSSGGEIQLATIGNSLTYTDSSVTNGQTYYYKVAAVNSVGVGAFSSEVSVTPTSSASSVPSAPQNLKATAGNAKVTLSWSAPSTNGGAAITAYKVYKGTTSGGKSLITTLTNVLTWTDTGVSNGRTYYYQVSAVNSIGEGGLSNEVSATPVSSSSSTVPSAPQNFKATGGSGKVTLTWSPPASDGGSPVAYYRIWRGTTSGVLSILTTRGDVLTWTNTGLTNGVTYFYKIAAINANGVGALSGQISVIPRA